MQNLYTFLNPFQKYCWELENDDEAYRNHLKKFGFSNNQIECSLKARKIIKNPYRTPEEDMNLKEIMEDYIDIPHSYLGPIANMKLSLDNEFTKDIYILHNEDTILTNANFNIAFIPIPELDIVSKKEYLNQEDADKTLRYLPKETLNALFETIHSKLYKITNPFNVKLIKESVKSFKRKDYNITTVALLTLFEKYGEKLSEALNDFSKEKFFKKIEITNSIFNNLKTDYKSNKTKKEVQKYIDLSLEEYLPLHAIFKILMNIFYNTSKKVSSISNRHEAFHGLRNTEYTKEDCLKLFFLLCAILCIDNI